MADGMLPYRLAIVGSSLTRGIRVAARDSEVSGDRRLTRENVLNVPNLSAPQCRDRMPFKGERSSEDAHVLSAAEIVALAAEVVSGSEIQARFGVALHDAACLLRRAGVGQRHNLGSATPPWR